MKRRDFLTVASAGASSAFLAQLAKAAQLPCPPPSVSVKGGSTAATTCTPPPPSPPAGTAPAWWANAAVGQWTSVAATGTLSAVAPSPPVIDSDTGQTAIISSWCGASVDQASGDYIMLANGGHGDYAGNEGYRLSLRTANPAWQRFVEPTPNGSIQYTSSGFAVTGAVNSDGRPRSMHTAAFPVSGDGRIWFGYENAFSSGNGGSMPAMFSFNYNHSALLAARAAGIPLAWDGGMGPWASLGPVSDTGSGISMDTANGAASFGCACWDRIGHKVWNFGGLGSDRTRTYVWWLSTSGSTLGQSGSYVLNSGNPYADFIWAVCVYDLGIIVASDSAHGRLIVFDLKNVGGSNWYTIVNTSGTGYYGGGVSGPFPGAAYIAANHTIAVGDPANIGNTIYRLAVPTTTNSAGTTVYNPSGTWVWSTINPGGAVITFPNDNKTYSKFNIIENMGDGSSALVYCGGVSAPTYVYKVPVSGL
jgi:hypothetical protein